METNLLDEVLDCLSEERRIMHYFKDKYAFFLLRTLLENQPNIKISELKNGPFANLLNKQLVKQLLAGCGNGLIDRNHLDSVFADEFESFVITLSEWGNKQDYSWSQISRPGKNLVDQLNFTGEHDQFMKNLAIDSNAFKYFSHPIHSHKNSVAWARIDFDFGTGEALIEEVQNDWLRKANNHRRWSKGRLSLGRSFYYHDGFRVNASNMLEYTENIIKRYSKLWSETMLFTTVQFIKKELGISKIFYHTVETAKVLKDLNHCFPPVSLYTDLPRKFCFKEIEHAPDFLLNEKSIKRRIKLVKKEKWFYLEV